MPLRRSNTGAVRVSAPCSLGAPEKKAAFGCVCVFIFSFLRSSAARTHAQQTGYPSAVVPLAMATFGSRVALGSRVTVTGKKGVVSTRRFRS